MRHQVTVYAIVIYAFLSFNFQCGKEDIQLMPQEEMVQLEMHLNINPLKKQYGVGDTIWMEADLSDRLLQNAKGNRFVKTDTVKFNIPVLFQVLNKQVLVPDGGFCEFINPNQLSISTSSGYYDPRYNVYWNYNTGTILNLGCMESSYQFKIGIKLRSKGAFYIGLSNSALTQCFDKPETVQNKYLSFRFSATDMNGDVYKDLPKLADTDPYRIGFDTSLINEKKAFIVQVN